MVKRRRTASKIGEDDYSDDSAYSEPTAPKRKRASGRASKSSASTAKHKATRKATAANTKSVDASVSKLPASHSVGRHILASPKDIQVALLHWFSGVRDSRGMPWRKNYNPHLSPEEKAQRAYEVWISEIMLQQTQVATVIPYWNKWMEKFPTIQDLATSDIEVVNSLWKGLGYYSRAARLLAGAQKVVNKFKGRLPASAKDLEEHIPGIGRYSAGAIASIAYGECAPVLDGNVHRLMSRMLALHASPQAKPTLEILWTAATSMVYEAQIPGDINQALIELGSTVCKVREPSCDVCPVQKWCRAYQITHSSVETRVEDIEELCSVCEPITTEEGGAEVTIYPMKIVKKKAREELDVVNIVEWRSTEGERWFLLVKRPEGGLLAGLHEFPSRPNVLESEVTPLRNVAHGVLSDLLDIKPVLEGEEDTLAEDPKASQSSVIIKDVKPAGDVLHIFSHIRKIYRAQWVLLEGGTGPPALLMSDTRSEARQTKGIGRQNKKDERKQSQHAIELDSDGEMVETSTSIDIKSSTPSARWIQIEHVSKSNISTGMAKVWAQTEALWSNKVNQRPVRKNKAQKA